MAESEHYAPSWKYESDMRHDAEYERGQRADAKREKNPEYRKSMLKSADEYHQNMQREAEDGISARRQEGKMRKRKPSPK